MFKCKKYNMTKCNYEEYLLEFEDQSHNQVHIAPNLLWLLRPWLSPKTDVKNNVA
jgi:hypothetical protein